MTDLFTFDEPEEATDVEIDPETGKPKRVKRKDKPYRAAVHNPTTRLTALASHGGLFDFEDGKPPLSDVYVTQAEIRKLQHRRGRTSVSLFTGMGGSKTGFAWSGFRGLAACEFVEAARDTLAANYDSYVVTPDGVLAIAERFAAEDVQLEAAERRIPAPLVTNKARKVRGKATPASVNWEKTFATLTDDERAAVRKHVTAAALAECPPGKLMVWGDDIRILCPFALMDFLGIKPGELDCLEGSPPCKSFSVAGLREKAWGETFKYSDERDQRTDDLFLEFTRILAAMQPKSFVAENVPGIGMGIAETDFMRPLMDEFRSLGYTMDARVLDSSNYGVPQRRTRMIFIGIRKDLRDADGSPARPEWPTRDEWTYTLQDALDISSHLNDPEEVRRCFIDPEKYENGRILRDLPLGGSPSNKAFQLVRSHPDLPVQTITAAGAYIVPAAGPCHPYEQRKFTIPEYRALFSIPQDFVFTGKYEQQAERMGRSVPVLLMKRVADAVGDVLDRVEAL